MLSRVGLCASGGARRAAAVLQAAAKAPGGRAWLNAPEEPADLATGISRTFFSLHNRDSYHNDSSSSNRLSCGQYHHGRTTESAVTFLQHATDEHELHTRLAALWGMPVELLFERQQVIARIMGPAGCSTAAHALWVLVRSPQLRHASEASLRSNLRQLHRLVPHADLDRAAVLTAVYKHPWIVSAMDTPTAPAAAASTHSCSSSSTTAHSQVQAHTQAQASAAAAAPATWRQELAAVLLERQSSIHAQQSQTSSSSSDVGMSLSPAFALAGVRVYVALAELAHQLTSTLGGMRAPSWLTRPLQPTASAATTSSALGGQFTSSCTAGYQTTPSSSSSSSNSPGVSTSSAVAADAGQHSADSPWSDPCGVSDIMQQLQQEQQQHLLLEQLLAACPHLVALPPELLLARWQRLCSGLQDSDGSSGRLLLSDSYLIMNYNDVDEAREDAELLRQSYA